LPPTHRVMPAGANADTLSPGPAFAPRAANPERAMTNTEQPAPTPPSAHATAAPGPTRTSLARPWLVRMIIITVVLWAFGAWAVWDATVVYPRRGRLHAERLQLDYLKAAQSSGQLFSAGVLDPKGTLAELRGRDITQISEVDRAKREWLEALAVPGLGMLDAEHTAMRDPQAELGRLDEYFAKNNAPAGLSAYDIPMQWLIVVVCWGLGLYMLALFAMVRSRRYSWDATTRTLTLPGGEQIAPNDLNPEEPADLSKWHKFIIWLLPRSGHDRLTAPIKLDLFRYAPLEDWVRDLVRGARPDFEFPDERKKREEAEAEAAAAGAVADEGAAREASQPPEP